MEELILVLAEKGILVNVVDNDLLINAPEGVLHEELLHTIRQRKQELIQYLSTPRPDVSDHFEAIRPAKEQPHYPLSSGQRSLWALSQFREGNSAYNMSGAYVFEGDLDTDGLEYALGTLIQRHESLRTVFRADHQGEVRQFIKSPDDIAFRITCTDLRMESGGGERIKQSILAEIGHPFDLDRGPVIRSALFRLEDKKWVFTYTMHHIISDGWSIEVLIRELLQAYNAYSKGEAGPLRPLIIQYKDFAVWQQEQLRTAAFRKHGEYWQEQLKGTLPVLDLPADRPRPAVKTYKGDTVRRTISQGSALGLQAISRQQEATLHMGLIALVIALLYKYTGQKDIILGSTTAGRDHHDLEDQIGFYVNTLALRARFTGSDSYRELLRTIRQQALSGYEHQSYPFDELIETLGIPYNKARSRVFDVMIELRDRHIDAADLPKGLGNIKVTPYEEARGVFSKFDLTFFFSPSDEGLNLLMEYNSDIFDQGTIVQLGQHMEQLLAVILEHPDTSLDRLEYLSPAEKDRMLTEFNRTETAFAKDGTVLSLFKAQVAKDPDAPALMFDGVETSYRELDKQSDQLAKYLRDTYGIAAGDLAGIMLDRSDKVIISLLGILKAGGGYVPVDPGYPAARRSFIFQDTGIKLLITQANYIYDLEGYQGAVVAIDLQLEDLSLDSASISTSSPGISRQPDQPAYVIYTSGSTGVPKGCVITDRNLFNYIQWANTWYFKDNEPANFGLYTSLSFDLTVTGIFCALTTGGRLYIYGQQEELPEILSHSFSPASGIDSIKITPSHIQALEHLRLSSATMRHAIVGGESLSRQQVNILKGINPSLEIYNEYGPTETTVGCIVSRVGEGNGPVLIGKPVANTRIYILDGAGSLCPVGVPGEIYISGDGVGRGYLNNPGLTTEKFLADPFSKGNRMYRSGDMGRWLPDGDIEYLGRKDEQVKLRGYRIEPGEIESILKGHPMVKTAVVLMEPEGDGSLAAYYVPAAEPGEMAAEDFSGILKAYLQTQLPAYMVPDQWIQVEHIPLNLHGKIDRTALQQLKKMSTGTGVPYIPARNATEEKLILIWQEVLGRERIGVKDSFFELGGHSLKAMRLIARISKEFNVDYNIDALFSHPTIEEVVAEIEKTYWADNSLVETENIDNVEKFTI